MPAPNLHIFDAAIDYSGTPSEDTYVALVTLNPYYRSKVISTFNSRFSEYRRTSWKGNKLNAKQLHQIMAFFGEHKMHCYLVRFTSMNWWNWKRDLSSPSFYHEKIHAILNYKLLKNFCMRGVPASEHLYNVSVDESSNFDVNLMIENCIRLCKGGRVNVRFNKSRAKFSEMMKFADFAASAYRKMSIQELKEMDHVKIVSSDLTLRELYKAFNFDEKPELLSKFKNMGNAPHRP